MRKVTVVGAGLAGCECALQLASRGIPVRLYEMRPGKQTSAHSSDLFAELVCSNSFRSEGERTAVGGLKREMRLLGSWLLRIAEEFRVPAANSLAVSREDFSREVTRTIQNHPLIEVVREEANEIPDPLAVIATGPLTSDSLFGKIREQIGDHSAYF